MRFTLILSLCVLVISAVTSHGQGQGDDDCNQENKQKSLYLKNYYEPSLDSEPATGISTSIVATLVEPLRQHDQGPSMNDVCRIF